MIKKLLSLLKEKQLDQFTDIKIYCLSSRLHELGFSFEYYGKYWNAYEENGKLQLKVIGFDGFEPFGTFDNETELFNQISNLHQHTFDVDGQLKMNF